MHRNNLNFGNTTSPKTPLSTQNIPNAAKMSLELPLTPVAPNTLAQTHFTAIPPFRLSPGLPSMPIA
ncbi:hypothetical protein Hypma_011135 [Hypsizygus marmoreus]|uniref:Uncharacterized protein n=1 Tax=Hypsizygus marmoreus TaxID=39966 RepID=A0A369JMX7_HYPMA|nr:hypothetical protein Hypma_011135 [Hypsizygus marmoreus]